MKLKLILVSCFIFLCPLTSMANPDIEAIAELKGAGLLLIDSQGKQLLSVNAQTLFIPASTTKLITAWLALSHWGEDHRFITDFYLDSPNKTLWVKGSGDPFLVSEELVLIANNLKALGLNNINTIALDSSQFQRNLISPGAGNSANPYDAIPTAIAANFNTLNLKRVKGRLLSAEKQTPLTPLANQFAKQHSLTAKKLRINSGQSSQQSERYFAELLAAFLRQQGLDIGSEIIWGHAPTSTTPYYRHKNSKNLAQIVRPMMKYSSNFIANQLVLILSAEHYQRPANFTDVQHYMENQLSSRLGFSQFVLKDGAGLSRENQLSPLQLVSVLESFRPWKALLPKQTTGIYAKSGTLSKISTLAGYVVDDNKQWNAFALMMKQSVNHRRRNQIMRELADKHL
ncbi:MAG: peptidase S13 [Gammaproteobacteria bacterium]|nr:MAG: peptidase S13 [Gammaproteobacteria bacterium]